MSGTITVVGLGAGDLNLLPLGVYRLLTDYNQSSIFLRTKEHPVVKELEQDNNFKFQSFDHIYEMFDNFEDVYDEIVHILLNEAKKRNIIYAVPGHPLIAERTVQRLLKNKDSIHIELAGGQSFLDPMFQTLQIDPIEGFQLLDGTNLKKNSLNINLHMIIGQVYDTFIASEVKLTLMEKLPDDYKVYIVTAAGTKGESIKEVCLYELDREINIDNLTTVYVPPVQSETLLYKEFDYFRDVISKLRGPGGCPWDQKQTHESLKKYLIEEAYELIEAINEADIDHIIEELGDVLLQVVLHAQIGEDDGYFSIDDVIQSICEKMIRRHPHVFSDVTVESEEDVLINWQTIKEKEKNNILESILPKNNGLPALVDAFEIQKAASKVGFDWNEVKPAIDKVKEELKEFEKELLKDKTNKHHLIVEAGDVLFSIINVARLLDIHPEEALQLTNMKFRRRFLHIEEQVRKSGKSITDFTLQQLDEWWNQAKNKECKKGK